MGNQGNEEDLALMADVARGDENAKALADKPSRVAIMPRANPPN